MAKGSSFEREFCKDLSVWWTGDEKTDVLFWRTAGSGGRATIRKKKNKKTNSAHCGDIAALEEKSQPLTELVTFELKRGYNVADLAQLADKKRDMARQIYEEWITQARASSQAAGTPFWAIVHRRDRRATMIHLPLKLVQALAQKEGLVLVGSDDLFKVLEPPFQVTSVRLDGSGDAAVRLRIVSLQLENFLKTFTKADILRVLKCWKGQ